MPITWFGYPQPVTSGFMISSGSHTVHHHSSTPCSVVAWAVGSVDLVQQHSLTELMVAEASGLTVAVPLSVANLSDPTSARGMAASLVSGTGSGMAGDDPSDAADPQGAAFRAPFPFPFPVLAPSLGTLRRDTYWPGRPEVDVTRVVGKGLQLGTPENVDKRLFDTMGRVAGLGCLRRWTWKIFSLVIWAIARGHRVLNLVL